MIIVKVLLPTTIEYKLTKRKGTCNDYKTYKREGNNGYQDFKNEEVSCPGDMLSLCLTCYKELAKDMAYQTGHRTGDVRIRS